MSKQSLQSVIENAIAKADSSYFFEDYTKQARAVIAAMEKAGYTVIPTNFAEDTWQKAADQMKTGRLKPDAHVKDVWETVLRIIRS